MRARSAGTGQQARTPTGMALTSPWVRASSPRSRSSASAAVRRHCRQPWHLHRRTEGHPRRQDPAQFRQPQEAIAAVIRCSQIGAAQSCLLWFTISANVNSSPSGV